MNIWYFHHYATPSSISGLHRPFEFGKYFVQSGHKVTVFASSYLHYKDDNVIDGKERYIKKIYDSIDTIFIKTKYYKIIGNFGEEGKISAEWKVNENSVMYNSPKLYKENGFKEKTILSYCSS